MSSNTYGRALADVDPDALSIPKSRALVDFLCSGHIPSVRLVEYGPRNNGDCEWITIELNVSIPQFPVYGIKEKEKIMVIFQADDQYPPGVYSMRADFPYAPHTNLQAAGESRSLCLYEQPWHEVKFDWNPARFLARIAWWLEETAHG